MDILLFRWMNGLAGRSPALDMVMVLLADWSSIVSVLVVTLMWFWPGPSRSQRRVEAVLIVLAILLALGLCELPAFVYARLRPYEVERVTLLVRAPFSPSFPSVHLATAGALVAAMGPRFGRWRYVGWALSVGSLFARVFVGIHFPSDVLVGLLTGWLAGAVVWHNRDALREFARRIASVGEELL
ncbi:MAG TPA: phosphatase PAP2 family protein [Symbiobacteriaceae bacterium]|nr:phosphatase PAP2 family protein [Symbiobacteriaceae bacterium]